MKLRLGAIGRLRFDKELRRKISLVFATILGFGTLVVWVWMLVGMAEARDEHWKTWPCASFTSYPMRDVPLRCLPGASSGGSASPER